MILLIKILFYKSWIQNTYYFDPNQVIPKSDIERSQNEIKYYQYLVKYYFCFFINFGINILNRWVSFFLLIQALLFYMPRIFWSTFSVKAGLSLADLVDAAINYK